MKGWLVAIALAVSCTLAAGAGFWGGFRQGWELAAMAEALPRGSVAVYQIGDLRAGNAHRVLTSLELDVDQGLLWAERLSAHPLRAHLARLSGTAFDSELDQYAARLAAHRRAYPSVLDRQAQFAADGRLQAELRQNAARIEKMVERYAPRKD